MQCHVRMAEGKEYKERGSRSRYRLETLTAILLLFVESTKS